MIYYFLYVIITDMLQKIKIPQKKFFDHLLNKGFSFNTIILSLCIIVTLRMLLENFSNPTSTGIISNPITLISFLSFYTAVFLSTVLVYKVFTNLDIKKITNFSLVTFLVILIPPIWDLVFTGGYCLSYTMDTGINLVKIFFTMGSHAPGCGISWGMRVAVITTVITSFLFIRTHTEHRNKTFVAIIGAIIMYSTILFQGAWLSIIGTVYEHIQHLVSNTGSLWLIQNSLKESFFATHHGFTLTEIWNNKQGESFSLFMMRLHIISITIVGWFIIKNSFKNIYTWFIKILPWKRIVMFIFFSVIGMVVADKLVFIKILSNPVNISGFITLCLGFIFHGITAIIVNDISDYDLDKVAHPERPLPSGLLSVEQYRNLGIVTCILGVMATVSINYTVTIFLIGVQSLYYMYTVQPLRLKQHWFNGLWIYAGIGLCVLATGYFFTSTNQVLLHAPWKLFSIIAFVFSITAFQKDIPDAFADRQFNINSLPVHIGEKRAIITSLIITPLLFGWLSFVFHSWILGVITVVFTCTLTYRVISFIQADEILKHKKIVDFVNTYIIHMALFFLFLIIDILLK